MTARSPTPAGFRDEVRAWLRSHVPPGWRAAMMGADTDTFIAFQRTWMQKLVGAGLATPHWEAGGRCRSR